MHKQFALTVLLVLGGGAAHAQPVKKAALKPQAERGVRGATPLVGDVGQLGVTYTLPAKTGFWAGGISSTVAWRTKRRSSSSKR